MPDEVGVQLFAPLHRFDRAQGPFLGGKVGSHHLKCRFDSAAWALPSEINAMENFAGCNEGLATVPGEVGVE